VGDVWVADAVGVLPDGSKCNSVHFWVPDGEQACWFKSLRSVVAGEQADDLVLRFTRDGAAAPSERPPTSNDPPR
jgi:hypothetical protein